MKRLMGIMAGAVLLIGCSENPAQGAAELCKNEVETRSKQDQGEVVLEELIAAAKPEQGGFKFEGFVYYRKGSPEQRRAPFSCVVVEGGQMQNLVIQPFPERF